MGIASLFICRLLSPCFAGNGVVRLCSCTHCRGVPCSWTAQAPQGDQQQTAASSPFWGRERSSRVCGAFVHFFPRCYNCIIKLSSQVRCRYCWWIVVACGSRDGKVCSAVCSLGTLRQVITPPQLLSLIHKTYKDVVSEARGKTLMYTVT